MSYMRLKKETGFNAIHIAAILLALLLVAVLPGIGQTAWAADGLLQESISSFTINARADMVNSVSSDKRQPVQLLTTLLLEAKPSAVSREKAKEIATITAKMTNSAAAVYTIYTYEKEMYAARDGRLYSISAKDFHKLINAMPSNFYKYRAVPRLSVVQNSVSSGALFVEKSSYIFRKVDERFYIPIFKAEANSWVLDGSAEVWPTLHFSLPDAVVSVRVFDTAGKQSFTGTWVAAGSYVGSHPGTHRIKVDATWNNTLYRGTVTYTFSAKGGTKAPKTAQERFSIRGDSTYPGEVMMLRITDYKNGEKITFASDINVTPTFFDDTMGNKIALMPVSYFTATGKHTITLTCGSDTAKWGISVQDKKFQIQNLTVDQSTVSSTIEDQNANAEYEKFIAPLRFVADAKQHWDGFTWPVTGPRSTEFGMIRYVNGAPTSSRHGAIDFAVPKGTSVKATANGRVLYAGFLQLTGNTVLIEHGYGLKSWYYHMDSLNVKTGAMVKMSEEIGKVGSTGFSTGAHLHFGMSVNNVFVNPDTIINTDLLAE